MADGILGSFLSGLGGFASTAGGALSPGVYQDQQVQQAQAVAAKRQQLQQAAQTIIAGLQNGSIAPEHGNAALQQINQAFQGTQIGPTPQAQGAQQALAANQAFTQWLQQQQGGGAPQGAPAAASQGIQPSALGQGQPQDAGTPAAPPQAAPQGGMAPGGLAGMPPSALTSPMGQNYIRALQAQKALEQTPPAQMLPIGKVNGVDMEQAFVQQGGQMVPVGQPRPIFQDKGTWSAPYNLNGVMVQNNSESGKVSTAASRIPASIININQGASGSNGMVGKSSDEIAGLSWDAFAKTMKAPLSGSALKMASLDYALTDKMPPLGLSGKGAMAQVRLAVMEGRSKIASEFGLTPEEMIAKPQTWKADAKAYTKVQSDISTFEPFKQMLDVNGDIAIKLGQKIANTNAAYINKPLNWLKQNATNNPDVSEYMFQINTLQTEGARVLNNPRLVGQLSDKSKEDMQSVMSGNMPIPAAERVIRRMQMDGSNRFTAMRNQLGELNKRLGGQSQATTAPPIAPAGSATAKPTVSNW